MFVETNETPVEVTAEVTPKAKPAAKRRKAHKYIAVNRLERSVGIEVTFIPGMGLERDDGEFHDVLRPLAHVFRRRVDAMKAPYYKCGMDPDCVEISTKPLYTRTTMRRTLAKYYDVAGSLLMETANDWHGGGGAHIHVGRKPNDAEFLDYFFADLSTRPYLTWAFMNPGDDNNNAYPVCTTLVDYDGRQNAEDRLKAAERDERAYRAECIKIGRSARASANQREQASYNYRRARASTLKLRRELKKHDRKADREQDMKLIRSCRFEKGNAVSKRHIGKYGTLEFRFFRAPDTMEGHEAQVNFALAYIEYVEGLVRDKKFPHPYTANRQTLRNTWTLEKGVAEFRKTLRQLGLPARDYAGDIANMAEYFRCQEMKYGKTKGQDDRPEYTCEEPRVSWRVIRDNIETSRALRTQRRTMRARRRKMQGTAWLLPTEVALTVGDTIRYAGRYGEARSTVINRERGDGTYPLVDRLGCYWSKDGTRNDEGWMLLEVNGIPVLQDTKAEPAPILYPTTAAECQGAHVDKESVIIPGEYILKTGDRVVMARCRNGATVPNGYRQEMIAVNNMTVRGINVNGHWGDSCIYLHHPSRLIWDMGAWIVEVNGRPVQGR